ncbi:MAG: MoaD/ThiS family protein [Candidatus Aminicenantes bacterium]|nr:MoaD/ThiS family protein [Candidatus Aminicenantes bacterium]
MKIKVKFFASMRQLFQTREREVDLPEGACFRHLLDLLCDSAERREGLFDKETKLNPNLVFLRNGQPIQSFGGLEARLEEGDVVAIFPLLGGG